MTKEELDQIAHGWASQSPWAVGWLRRARATNDPRVFAVAAEGGEAVRVHSFVIDTNIAIRAVIHADADHIAASALMHPATMLQSVPKWGEIALLFALPKSARESLPGDLAEEFNRTIVPKMGLRLARGWYWWQVVRAAPWLRLVALYDLLKWKLGL